MKRSRFTEKQIIGVLREQEAGSNTADVCRRHGISTATWKAKYGGMEVSEARRLKALEGENAKLKKASACKKILTPATKHEAVAHLRTGCELSERRACSIIGGDRTTMRYRSRRAGDEVLRVRMRELAAERRRFGYPRAPGRARCEPQTTQRLYREEGLTVRRRRGRKRATGARAPLLWPTLPNTRWSIDFVHDQRACGRRFRILNIIDDVTKECLAAVADTSI